MAVLVHGYHPYAEDGGIYLTGVKYLLNRHLYPYATEFATAHLGFSVYAQCVAGLVRWTGWDVMIVLFGLYVLSIWTTLIGTWHLASLLLRPERRDWAVAVLASALTMPVAGTSLMLLDPYVSARSLSTPCLIFALYWALAAFCRQEKGFKNRTQVLLCCLCCGTAVLLHPLMGGYGVVVLLLSWSMALRQRGRRWIFLVLSSAAAFAVAFAVQRYSGFEPEDYAIIAQTRTYWFLSEWRWYEWAGLLFPLGILTWFGLRRTDGDAARLVARAAVAAGVLSVLVSLLLVHRDSTSYALARLQPLRVFQMIYFVMILFLGACVRVPRNGVRVAGAICCICALSFFTADRLTYAHSNHLEFPWTHPVNPWTQGFLWLRGHTSVNDVIAVDAHYISAAGEDAQNLRAIAERSTPPDFSKDGGIASIVPRLAREWFSGEALVSGLNQATDSERVSRLSLGGIGWIVLDRTAKTKFECPYRNDFLRICKIPPSASAGGLVR